MSDDLTALLTSTRNAICAITPANNRKSWLIRQLRDALNGFQEQMQEAINPLHDWQSFAPEGGMVQSAKCAKCATVRLKDSFHKQYTYVTLDEHGDFVLRYGEEDPCGGAE